SAHTIRNYESDLRQYIDYVAPADENGKRKEPPLAQIDHLTIREWLATPRCAPSFNSSCAKASPNRTRPKSLPRRAKKRNFRSTCRLKMPFASSKRPTWKLILANATARFSSCSTRRAYAFPN